MRPAPSCRGRPTMTVGGTRDGMILGTAAYMSPEQARGQAVDKRTDIWAFGCVLYEMLTGRPAFARATMSDTIAAVLTDEPDWTALPRTTPPYLSRLLKRCLEKDPTRRQRDIGDARLELAPGDDAGGRSGAARTSTPLARADGRRRWSRGRRTGCRGVCPRRLSPSRALAASASDPGSLFRVPASGQQVLSQRRHDVPRALPGRIATGIRRRRASRRVLGSGSGRSQASMRGSCPAPRGPGRSSGRLTVDPSRSLRAAS